MDFNDSEFDGDNLDIEEIEMEFEGFNENELNKVSDVEKASSKKILLYAIIIGLLVVGVSLYIDRAVSKYKGGNKNSSEISKSELKKIKKEQEKLINTKNNEVLKEELMDIQKQWDYIESEKLGLQVERDSLEDLKEELLVLLESNKANDQGDIGNTSGDANSIKDMYDIPDDMYDSHKSGYDSIYSINKDKEGDLEGNSIDVGRNGYREDLKPWVEFRVSDLGEQSKPIEATFTVSSISGYLFNANTPGSKASMVKYCAKGSISGLSGTYEVDIPYGVSEHVSEGTKFKVWYKEVSLDGFNIISDISTAIN